jgi:DNA-binding beta-propeller fold protein YncE
MTVARAVAVLCRQNPLRVGNSPLRVAVSPDGTHLYVTNAADNTVSVIAV